MTKPALKRRRKERCRKWKTSRAKAPRWDRAWKVLGMTRRLMKQNIGWKGKMEWAGEWVVVCHHQAGLCGHCCWEFAFLWWKASGVGSLDLRPISCCVNGALGGWQYLQERWRRYLDSHLCVWVLSWGLLD